MGTIFGLVGGGLTLGIITALVGIPFLLFGVAMLGGGGAVFIWRYKEARRIVTVLREGEATRGRIIETQADYSVHINGRNPWVIRYQFQAHGQDFEGKVSTLREPGDQLREGKAVCVLFLPTAPQSSTIYPHP
jgi:hypothetical protein